MGEIRSTIKKLWRHLPYILDIENETRPICLVIHLTNKCNLNCDFCYIKNSDRTQELDYDKLIKFIDVIKPKSVQLTGGEPCLYPKINELIMYLAVKDIEIGMFTNGVHLKNIKYYILLEWLRVSINYYIDTDIEFKDTQYTRKLGYVYVNHRHSPEDLKEKLVKFMENHQGQYLKVINDVFDTTWRSKIRFKSIPLKRIEVQEKEPTKSYKGKCYMGFLKPYLNGDGLVYPCVSTVDPETRRRDESKAITDIDHPYDLLHYHDINMDCEGCRFWDRNNFINYIKKEKVEDENFL